jgi:hypothetical protein
MLARIWTGIVGAVAGAAIGLMVGVIMIQVRASLDSALMATWVCAGVGLVCGVVFGKPRMLPPQK